MANRIDVDEDRAIVVTNNDGEPFIIFPFNVIWCNGERIEMSPMVHRLVHRLIDDVRDARDDADALRHENDALHTEVTGLRSIIASVPIASLPREFWSDIRALIEN